MATQSSPRFLARKGNRKQYFTEMQWNLLGKNKEGWTRSEDQMIVGEKPNTGQKTIMVEPEKKAVPVDNEVKEAPPERENSQTVTGDEKKDEFMLAIEGYTKNTIKNLFDSKEQPYDKKATIEILKEQLGEFLNWDTTLL